MSYSFDGANDRMTGTFTSTYALPVTIACWVKITDHPVAEDVLVAFGNSGSSDNDSIRLNTTSTDNQWSATAQDSAAASNGAATVQTYDNTWVPVVGKFTSSTDRKIYVGDYANTGSNTVERIVAGALQYLQFGERLADTNDFLGKLAEPAIWDVALSQADIEAYIAGNAASGIDAANLIGYWPLSADNATQANEGVDAGGDLTVTGATYDADHPTIGSPAPTFDTSPTVTSQTATAYTLTYDADANATDIYVGIYLKDATPPTDAEIKAGTNAHGTATEATTGASDTITVTASESPAFPIYDIWYVLEGPGGFSATGSLLDEALDPATGKQHITVDVPWGASEESILDGASPAAVDGDIIVIDTHVDSAELGADAHALTCAADGVVSVDPGLDTSRLDFYFNVYDVSAGGWLNASPVRDFINNVAPVYSDETSTFLYKKDTAITAMACESYWTDQEGDALTITLQDSLPAGLSFGSEQITGTPTAYGRTVVTVRATDITAEYTDHDITIEVGDELPDVTGIGRSSAEGVIGAFMSCTTQVVEAIHASVAAGQVYGQEPEAGTLVPHDQLVTLLVSLGASASTGGGVSFFDAFEKARRRREKKRREEDEAEEAAALLKAEADREIATLLQEQERKDSERQERERLQALAQRYAGENAAELYGERLAKAMQRAAEKGTYSAIEGFVREAKRAQEEEAFIIRAAIMAIELNG